MTVDSAVIEVSRHDRGRQLEHRSLDPAARLRYVNVAAWDSAEQFDAAHDGEFVRMQAQPEWSEFPAAPALYTVEQETVAQPGEAVPAAG